MTPHQGVRRAIIDDSRSACLCDAGLPGIVAAVCVNDDGHSDLVLIVEVLIGNESATFDPTTPCAPHEQPGPLPAEYVDLITRPQRTARCGRRTKSGALCRTPVGREGDTCFWHGGAR